MAHWGNIKRACRGIAHRNTVHEALKADPAFKAACGQAREVACEELEAEALRRVYEGEPVLYRGRPVRGVRTFDNKLLIELLRAAWPEKYGRQVHHDVTWPQVEKMMTEGKLSLEQLDAIAAGMSADVVLAMAPKKPGTVH
jgi:hypothetical protein